MGRTAEEARRVVRISGGWSNGPEHWVALADAFGVAFEGLGIEERGSQVISL